MKRIAPVFLMILYFHLAGTFVMPAAQETDTWVVFADTISQLKKEGKFTEALEMSEQHLELLKGDKDANPDHVEDVELMISTFTLVLSLPDSARQELAYGWKVKDKVDTLYTEGDYQASAMTMQEQLVIFKKYFGTEHVEFAEGVDIMGQLLYHLGDYKQAGEFFKFAYEARQKIFSENHYKISESINNMAAFYHSQKDYSKAEEFFRRSLEMKKLDGEETEGYAASLGNLALALNYLEKYDEAEPLMRQALAISTRLKGEEDPDTQQKRNNLAALLHDMGDFEGAEKLHRKALEIKRKNNGDNHPDTALSLHNLSRVLRSMGRFDEARDTQAEALAIRRERLGDEHPLTITSLAGLAMVLKDLGDYDGAEKIYREALAIQRGALGEEHPEVAEVMNNLASILHTQGNFKAADPLLRESLVLTRKAYGDKHNSTAMRISNMGTLLNSQGNYLEAAEFHREALAIRRELYGEKHSHVASSLNGLAHSLEGLGRKDEAEQLFREALAIRRELHDGDDPRLVGSLSNLAHFLTNAGKKDEAEVLLREALDMIRRLWGHQHPTSALIANNLGALLSAQGKLEEAEVLLTDGLAYQRETLGITNSETITSLMNLGMLQLENGQLNKAEATLTEAVDGFDAARIQAGTGISRAKFHEAPYTWLAAVQIKMNKPEDAWFHTEQSRGRILADLMLATGERDLTAQEKNRETGLRKQLASLETELAAYSKSGRTGTRIDHSEKIKELQGRLEVIQAEWSGFQRDLASKYPVSEGKAYSLDRIQKTLRPDEAILGWLEPNRKVNNRFIGWVYVIRNNGPIHWAELEFSTEKPGVFQGKLKDELGWPTREVSAEVEDFCRTISTERLWPVMDALEGVVNLVVIPSGPMLGVPVEAMLDQKGQLLADRFVISYVPSATILAWQRERDYTRPNQDKPRMLLVGDPPFCEAHLAEMNEPETVPAILDGAVMDVAVVRSLLSGNRDAASSLIRLPASRDEVEMIAGLAEKAKLLIGPDASEQNVDQLAESGDLAEYDVIHLATHALVDVQDPGNSSLILSQVDLPDPFEAAAKGDPIYTGMITAEDIIREWKLGADLVTLSACETGLGLEVEGEGYVGFMHAFLQVGARSLIVSLWKVDDRATSLLMQRFYRNYLGAENQPMSKAEALQEAKAWLRGYTDEAGDLLYQHPAFWSGFILVGDRD